MENIEPVQDLLRDISKDERQPNEHYGIGYNLVKGTAPTVSMESLQQAEDIVGALR